MYLHFQNLTDASVYIAIEEFGREGCASPRKPRACKAYAVTSTSLALFGKCRFTKIHVWNKGKMAANGSGVRSEISVLMKSWDLL